jgi:DNA-binding response OmpR family regulator
MQAVSRRQCPGSDPAEAFHVPINRGNPAEISPISSSLPSGGSTLVAAAIPAVDRFVLDLNRGVLLADGLDRAVRAKTFALLLHLVENAERLIDRDEITHAIWPDVFVADDSITQCIREFRRALDDDEQRLVRTLPRRGYSIRPLTGPARLAA